MTQLELAGEAPDVVVGCVGGGSNFAGLAFPFVRRVLRGRARTRFLAAEPAACPTLTRGAYRYDFGDTVGLTPLLPMYTLGHDFVPPPVHAGGLRYHGDAPLLCALVQGRARRGARLPPERRLRGRAALRAHAGIIPAPEPAHAIRAAIDEALAAREAGEPRVILLGLSGHGHFDLSAYDAYLAGTLEDPEFDAADMEAALARLPDAPAIALAPRSVALSGALAPALLRPARARPSISAGGRDALAAAARRLRRARIRAASRISAELGHGIASPLCQAGGVAPVIERPTNSIASAPSQ